MHLDIHACSFISSALYLAAERYTDSAGMLEKHENFDATPPSARNKLALILRNQAAQALIYAAQFDEETNRLADKPMPAGRLTEEDIVDLEGCVKFTQQDYTHDVGEAMKLEELLQKLKALRNPDIRHVYTVYEDTEDGSSLHVFHSEEEQQAFLRTQLQLALDVERPGASVEELLDQLHGTVGNLDSFRWDTHPIDITRLK